jgi:NADH:ubiquinone oxidoreductase subunit C
VTQDELLAKFTAKFPKAAKAQAQIKDYLTIRLSGAEEVLPAARFLRNELGFDYLEIVSATDWLGPVSQEGYIKNPNPNVFLPEGATPQIVAAATPGFNYRPVFDLLWLFGNLKERTKVFLRLEVPRQNAWAPSLVPLFKAADWQEREVFDLLGIRFEGHPHLVKILTPDFTVGHPLRKDYVHVKDKYDE